MLTKKDATSLHFEYINGVKSNAILIGENYEEIARVCVGKFARLLLWELAYRLYK
jgi:hypothetical protein